MAQTRTRRVRAAQGTESANFGTEQIPVGADGTADVPDEAVDSLTSNGGFALADIEVAPPPEGHVEVDHEDQGASLSFGGVSYARGEDGRFFVPLAVVPYLDAHGFRIVPLSEVAARLAAALDDVDDAADGDAATPAADAPTPVPAATDPAPADPAADETPAA